MSKNPEIFQEQINRLSLDEKNKTILITLKKLYVDSLTYQNDLLSKITNLEKENKSLKAVYDLEHEALNRVSAFNESHKEKLEKIKEWIFHEELLIKKYLKENKDWAKCEDDCIAELKEILGDDMK